MHTPTPVTALAAALALAACTATPQGPRPDPLLLPVDAGPPRTYAAPRAATAPVIDGVIDDPAWEAAPWTTDFVDIRGAAFPTPPLRTRARMLWDDGCLYIAAELEEPHLWATLTTRDSIIFHDPDFEVFIDPDGDTHQYYELEVNALGTDWDLFLVRPYRDGGPALHGWDIAGLETEAAVRGTLNDPSDTDTGWSVEIAIPWTALAEAAHRPAPPAPGDTWRMNFSRVEWHVRVEDGAYVKDLDPATGMPLPEENWVWSPQGIVNMHYPETWGYVRFVTTPTAPPPLPADHAARRRLRHVYFTLRNAHAKSGSFRGVEVSGGRPIPGWDPPVIEAATHAFTASMGGRGGRRLWIREDGRIWMTKPHSGD